MLRIIRRAGGGEEGVEAAAHALPVAAGPVQARAAGTAGERLLLHAHHRRQAVQDRGLGHRLQRIVAAHAPDNNKLLRIWPGNFAFGDHFVFDSLQLGVANESGIPQVMQ